MSIPVSTIQRKQIHTTSIKPEVLAYASSISTALPVISELERTTSTVIWGYWSALSVKRVGTKVSNRVEYLCYSSEGHETLYTTKHVNPGENAVRITFSKIIWLANISKPSLPALRWCAKNGIEIVVIDADGYSLTESYLESFDTDGQRMQAILSEDASIAYMTKIIQKKIRGHIKTLETHKKAFFSQIPENSVDVVIHDLRAAVTRLGRAGFIVSLDHLREIEGQAAIRYFSAWQGLKLSWLNTDGKVPGEWKFFSYRSDHGKMNSRATHPLNAVMNLAFHIVEDRIARAVLANGLSPFYGMLHTEMRSKTDLKKMPLVFDLVEVFRGSVENVILEFMRENSLDQNFFFSSWGHVRCEPIMVQIVSLLSERAVSDSAIAREIGAYRAMLSAYQDSIPGMSDYDKVQLVNGAARHKTTNKLAKVS